MGSLMARAAQASDDGGSSPSPSTMRRMAVKAPTCREDITERFDSFASHYVAVV